MISIVIPMYNEQKRCTKCIETLDGYLKKTFDRYEIVAVNDGSTDNTTKLLGEAAKKYPSLKLCSYEKNLGKGGAIRTGILSSKYPTVLYTDCDLAYGTDIIGRITAKLAEGGDDIIIGSRNISADGYHGYTALRKLVSKVYMHLISLTAGFRHSDSQCGIKCFGNDCAKKIFSHCEINSFAFDLEVLMTADKMKLKVGEYPVKIINHNQGESKVNMVRDTLKMLRDIKKIKKRLKTEPFSSDLTKE